MRPIKFRVWNESLKQWVDPTVCFLGSDGVFFTFDGGLHKAAPHYKLVFSTGLHDKNGKEIFEGDLLSSCPIGYIPETRKPGEVGEVIWIEPKKGYHEEPSHGWMIKTKRGLTNITVWLHVTGCGHEEVLGNIYEHRHLLNAQP